MAKELTAFQKRCEDCACLVKGKGGVWCCDECFGQPIEEVTECPEGVTFEEVKAIEEKTAHFRAEHDARAENSENKPKKPRTVKISDEKQILFQSILHQLDRCELVERENVEVLKENKLISVKIGEKVFKIDIIETRNKK